MKKTVSDSHFPPVKAALLGLHHPHSGILLDALHNLPEVGGVFVWDENARSSKSDALRNRRKLELFTTDLDGLLTRRDLDFAVVCVRTDLAAEIASRVATAGKHVLVEKPVGLDCEEIRELISLVGRRGTKAGVLYANRLHPAAQGARALVRSGGIGQLLSLEARLLTTQVRFRDPGSWLFRRRFAGGGILTWLGCHYLDLLYYVSGDPIVSVFAQLARRSGEKIDVEDTAAIALKFRSGAVGTFNAGYALAYGGDGYLSSGYDAYLAYNGRKGRVVWSNFGPRLHIEGPQKRQAPVRTKFYRLGGAKAYGEDLLRQFIAAFQEETELPTTLSDALRTARTIEAIHQSAKTGRETRVVPA